MRRGLARRACLVAVFLLGAVTVRYGMQADRLRVQTIEHGFAEWQESAGGTKFFVWKSSNER